MDDTTCAPPPLGGAAKRFARRLLAIGENRFHLLLIEVQEERDHVLNIVFLGVVTATLGLLGGMAWTVALVIHFWQYGPESILLILGAAYLVSAIALYLRMGSLRRNQHTLEATLEQLRKDRACLKEN